MQAGDISPSGLQDRPDAVCPPGNRCFADVLTDNPFYEFVNRIYQQDLVSGYACGGPGGPCDPEGRPYYDFGIGVEGFSDVSTGVNGGSDIGPGVNGKSFSGNGVVGFNETGSGYGVLGYSAGNRAGQFLGNVQVTGSLSKGAGSFKIDHPLDPANKYLYHSFVESPDMLNIYRGTVALDSKGEAE